MKPIDTLFIAGVGLIGGSLGLSLKKNNLVTNVIGFGRSRKNLELAKSIGAIDEIATDLKAAKDAEIILLAVPVFTIDALAQDILPHLNDTSIVTDVGSTKMDVISRMRTSLGYRFPQYIPGHPIAGGEKSGAGAAKSDLFTDHKVLLTPEKDTNLPALTRIADMWSSTGATVTQMQAEHHDVVLALTSHLPHVLAFALVNYLTNDKHANQCFELAAGGFLDFTRIASSDPEMWRDICLSNKTGLLKTIDKFSDELATLRGMIASGEKDQIEAIFRNARSSRDKLVDHRTK
jgi:prephenate dehydrogenase